MVSLLNRFMKSAQDNLSVYFRQTLPDACFAEALNRMATARCPDEMLDIARNFENLNQSGAGFYADLARQARLSLMIEQGKGVREALNKLHTLDAPEPVMDSIVRLHQAKEEGHISIPKDQRRDLHRLCHEVAALLGDPRRIERHITMPTYTDDTSLRQGFAYFDHHRLAPVVGRAVGGLARHFDKVRDVISQHDHPATRRARLNEMRRSSLRNLERQEAGLS